MCIGTYHRQYSQSDFKAYSRNELCDIRDTIHNSKPKFENATFSNIQNLGIGKRRGKRGGKKLLVKNNIEVILNNRNSKINGYGVDAENLIEVKCSDLNECRPNHLRLGLINARSICNKVDIMSDTISS